MGGWRKDAAQSHCTDPGHDMVQARFEGNFILTQKQNLQYIDQTDVEGTLAIEKEIMQLLTEIEQLKGRLRKLTVDRNYALAQVNLQILGQSLPTDIPSSFGWINTIDFYTFVDEGF